MGTAFFGRSSDIGNVERNVVSIRYCCGDGVAEFDTSWQYEGSSNGKAGVIA